MRLTTATEPEQFIGAYGNRWREGLLSDHLDLFIQAGGAYRPSRGEGAGWAVVDGRGIPARRCPVFLHPM